MSRTVRAPASGPVRPWYCRENRANRKKWTRKNRQRLRSRLAHGQFDRAAWDLKHTGGWWTH